MTIDIVDLTAEGYNNLNAVQLAMVRAAQAKKNKVLAQKEEAIRACDYLSVKNCNARASVYQNEREQIAQNAEQEIAVIKDDLEYQLAYEALGSEGNSQGPYRYPENPNYNLAYSQRFLVVRNYYMSATDDAEARLQAFTMDTLAREYLGEFYQTLYDLLASYC